MQNRSPTMARRIGPFRSVTVFGGANIDRVATAAGPTILGVSNPGRTRTFPGGVGLNVAAALAGLGHPVRLVTRVGADRDGETIVATAAGSGVDTAGIAVSPHAPTASYQAAIDDRGGLVIGIADMSICDEISAAEVAAAVAATPADDLWVVDANLSAETLDFLVGEAAARGRPVVALAVSPAKAVRLVPLLDRLTLLFANRREAAAILGRKFDERHPPAAELAAALGGELVPHAVISNGADPVAVASDGGVRSFAPLKARVKSVNGGGDALAAGTIHALADGRGLFEAVMSGLAAAAIAVESEGTVLTGLTPALLAERIGASETPQPA
jgi:pseudouridine kinase